MTLFGKERRESRAAFEHWNNRFGHFENLHGVRQSIWEITELVQAAVRAGSPGELRERSRRFADHAAAQRELAEDARTLARLLDGAWTGDASVTAQTKFAAFVTDAQDTGRTLETNSNNLAGESQAFADLAAAMKPLPPMEATRQWLFSEPSWTKEFLANWEFENDRIHHAQENLQAYENYHQLTEHNIGQVSTDYPRLPGLPPDSELSTSAGAPDMPSAGWPGAGSAPWTGDSGAGSSGYPGAGSGHYPGIAASALNPAGRPGASDAAFSGTTAASFQPDLVRGGGPAEIRPPGGGFGPAGGSPPGGGIGSAGGAAGGFGPTGSGHGTSGAGRTSGPGLAGSQAGGTRAAGAGQQMMRGAAGTGAPMGGAGRGQGGEDEEYRGRGILHEPDPDGLFGVGEPTVPPVIGEGWD